MSQLFWVLIYGCGLHVRLHRFRFVGVASTSDFSLFFKCPLLFPLKTGSSFFSFLAFMDSRLSAFCVIFYIFGRCGGRRHLDSLNVNHNLYSFCTVFTFQTGLKRKKVFNGRRVLPLLPSSFPLFGFWVKPHVDADTSDHKHNRH